MLTPIVARRKRVRKKITMVSQHKMNLRFGCSTEVFRRTSKINADKGNKKTSSGKSKLTSKVASVLHSEGIAVDEFAFAVAIVFFDDMRLQIRNIADVY